VRKKFTLVELMIVLAILTLLLSILYPSLTKAREQTRRALCKSNQQQIAQAVSFYSGINNGRISMGIDEGSYQASYMFNSGNDGHTFSYYSYFKEDLIGAPEIWYCPSNKSEFFQYNGKVNRWPPVNGKTKTRAAYNNKAVLDGADHPLYPSLSTLSSQSLLSDIVSRRGLYDQHHKNGSNVLFLDGSSVWAELPLIEDLLNTMSRYHATGNNANFLKMFKKFDSLCID